MAKKKYYSMNQVPIGAKMKVKKTGEEVVLVEIQNFPTTFKTVNEAGNTSRYYTYEVEIDGWPPSS